MKLEERLSYCQTCNKRGFNPKFGVVCSLTNELPNFKNSCIDYHENAKELNEVRETNFYLITVLRELTNKNYVQLSSDWTKANFLFSILVPLIPFLSFLLGGVSDGFSTKSTIGIVIFVIILIVLPLLYSRLTLASIENGKIKLQRIFQHQREFEFLAIKEVDSFQLRRSKYIICKMQNEKGEEETYVILGVKSILYFENIDTERVLIAIKKYDELKRFVK